MDPSQLTTTGAEIYDSIAPLMDQDEAYGYPGATLVAGLAKMIDPVATIVRDQDDGTPGWAILFQPSNPDLDPSWLPWIAQFVGDGAAVQNAPTTQAKLDLIDNPQNFAVGLPDTIRRTAVSFLSGTQTIYFNSNFGGNPFALEITTLASETPANTTAMRAAVMAVTPAWMVLTFVTTSEGTYEQLDSAHASYSQLEAAHTSYSDLELNPGA